MNRKRLLAAGTLLAAIACGGEPTGPPDSTPQLSSQRIAVGDTAIASFAAGDTLAFYSVQSSEPAELTLFLQAEQGNFGVTITDSITGEYLGSAVVMEDPVPGHLLLTRSDIVQATAGRVLLVRVYNYAGASSRLRILVYRINRAPETLAAALTVEDTLQGETLENTADIDEFSFSGTAGQSVSATIQAPFAFDGAYVELALIDPSSGTVLGTARTWDATVASTGSMTLPATGTYLVRVAPVDDTVGKGGYRFLIQ